MKKASLRDLKQPTLNAPRTGSRHKRVLSGSPFHPRAPPPSRDQFLRSSALSSAQVFKAYPKIAALENRTFHLFIKPDILTCYQQLLHLRAFLLELGLGFAFVASQYRLDVSGSDFFVDLLFYHLKLRCFVVIDLK